MMFNQSALNQLCQNIAERCTGCRRCMTGCLFLQETGLTPADMAARGPSTEEAYSCNLCGLCETLCPVSLKISTMFSEARKAAVEQGQVAIEEYRYMFPDRKNNMMAFYRKHCNLQYDDLRPDQESKYAFFPGCVMLTYAPELVRTVYANLQNSKQDLTLITDCCGLPLVQLGVAYRYDKYTGYLKQKLAALKVEYLITACPNCYYQFRSVLANSPIKTVTVYETLEIKKLLQPQNLATHPGAAIAVHDSCPDRREGIFAKQVRKMLTRKGYAIRELPNNRELATCCGSGGQITHFRPELAEKLVDRRWQEFRSTGAQILTAYCLGCVLNLAKKAETNQVQHVLSLLLDLPQDFTGTKKELGQIFEGEQGAENWEKVMNEGETDHGL